jgi:hypothetical protein
MKNQKHPKHLQHLTTPETGAESHDC